MKHSLRNLSSVGDSGDASDLSLLNRTDFHKLLNKSSSTLKLPHRLLNKSKQDFHRSLRKHKIERECFWSSYDQYITRMLQKYALTNPVCFCDKHCVVESDEMLYPKRTPSYSLSRHSRLHPIPGVYCQKSLKSHDAALRKRLSKSYVPSHCSMCELTHKTRGAYQKHHHLECNSESEVPLVLDKEKKLLKETILKYISDGSDQSDDITKLCYHILKKRLEMKASADHYAGSHHKCFRCGHIKSKQVSDSRAELEEEIHDCKSKTLSHGRSKKELLPKHSDEKAVPQQKFCRCKARTPQDSGDGLNINGHSPDNIKQNEMKPSGDGTSNTKADKKIDEAVENVSSKIVGNRNSVPENYLETKNGETSREHEHSDRSGNRHEIKTANTIQNNLPNENAGEADLKNVNSASTSKCDKNKNELRFTTMDIKSNNSSTKVSAISSHPEDTKKAISISQMKQENEKQARADKNLCRSRKEENVETTEKSADKSANVHRTVSDTSSSGKSSVTINIPVAKAIRFVSNHVTDAEISDLCNKITKRVTDQCIGNIKSNNSESYAQNDSYDSIKRFEALRWACLKALYSDIQQLIDVQTLIDSKNGK